MNRSFESSLSFTEIEFGSDWRQQEIQLRDRLLRKPLGLRFSDAELEEERQQLHYGALHDGSLIACVVAVPVNAQRVKLRQMAVDESWQRQGVGSFLLYNIENALASLGYKELYLHARTAAVAFYERLGYQPHGEPFTEVSVPHLAMRKQI